MGGEEWRIREFVNSEAILCGTAFLDTRDYSFVRAQNLYWRHKTNVNDWIIMVALCIS